MDWIVLMQHHLINISNDQVIMWIIQRISIKINDPVKKQQPPKIILNQDLQQIISHLICTINIYMSRQDGLDLNKPFAFSHHKKVIYIPVYPRAYVEEVTNIDYGRGTVTAKFVIMITICLKLSKEYIDNKLKQYIKQHLILEFGFNQIVFIPEHMTLQNSPYFIRKVHSQDQDYVTYQIKGDFECQAQLDSKLFPYRKIYVTNHLCIRPQEFKDPHYDYDSQQQLEVDVTQKCQNFIVRYNIMELMEGKQPQEQKEHEECKKDMAKKSQCGKKTQFLPYKGHKYFGQFKIDHITRLVVGQNPIDIRQILKDGEPSNKPSNEIVNEQERQQKEQYQKDEKDEKERKRKRRARKQREQQLAQKQFQSLKPQQHLALRFTMSSLSLGFVWQQEVPIWMLSIITIALYEAQPNIGNKYSNIILLLVSFVSIISNFRRNNDAQQILTFYQWKLIVLVLVPILLIISTAIDYYHMDRFNERSDQMVNPFAIASLVIVFTSFAATLIILIYLWVTNFLCDDHNHEKTPTGGDKKNICLTMAEGNKMIQWPAMKELEWGNKKLKKTMQKIIEKSKERSEKGSKQKEVFVFEKGAQKANNKSQESKIEFPIKVEGKNS